MKTRQDRRRELLDLIDSAIDQGPYRQDPHLHSIYTRALLRELLATAAESDYAIHRHLRGLSDKDPENPARANNKKTPL